MNMDIVRADNTDLREILELQYLAYQSEAALFGSKDIPPLKETLSELEAEFEKGIILKMVDDSGKIIGSVRSRSDEETVYIGKLMVHPDQQKKGYGKKLLCEIERYYPNKRFELFTSTRSIWYFSERKEHVFGSNCLPSLSVDSLSVLEKKINGREVCFPLTRIKDNWVVEIVDSEGNHIEMTAPAS